MNSLIVTLDGPAGSGKSTVAQLLAKRLGVDFLDTGAMYRGITACAILRGIDISNEPYALIELARNQSIRFDWTNDPPSLFIGNLDLTSRIRDSDVTSLVSDVAAMGPIREVLVEAQRQIGREHPRLVTEGRDQGSVVFPGANVKFYLDAKPRIRAQRRARQLREAGKPADVETIYHAILTRDQKDSSRKDSPLVCPTDAEYIDTSSLSQEQVVDLLESKVRQTVELTA